MRISSQSRAEKSKPTQHTQSHSPSLQDIVGKKVYETWVEMLSVLVPNGRTHRLSVVVAAMLNYAYDQCSSKSCKEGSAEWLLTEAQESGDYDGASDSLAPLLQRLFRDAGVKYQRTNSRGQKYSIIEDSIQEFMNWENMPWE